jgi:hypothetical protein
MSNLASKSGSDDALEKIRQIHMPLFLGFHYGMRPCLYPHGKGRRYFYHCPFHPPDKRPSFSISYSGLGLCWLWYDNHSREGGNLITLVAQLEGCNNGEAVRFIKNSPFFNE